MLARVALLTYWMARYLERAENTARILDVNTQLALDTHRRQALDDPKLWEPVVFACGSDELFRRHHATATERNVVEFVLFDHANPSSIYSCVSQARENARCIREQITSEMWEQLNRLYLTVKKDGYEDYQRTGASDYLLRLESELQLFIGITESMFPRSDGWDWLQLGRFLERADNVSRIVDVKYFSLLPAVSMIGGAIDIVQWAAVLRSCSALEAFRRSGHGHLTVESIVGYLVHNPLFPRSLRFAAREVHDTIAKISRPGTDNAALAAASDLLSLVDGRAIKDILSSGLHEFLDAVQLRAGDVASAVDRTFIHYPVDAAPTAA